MNMYEPFKELHMILNEEDFELGNKESIDELHKFIDDSEAEKDDITLYVNEEEQEKDAEDYIGEVALKCPVCGTLQMCKEDELELDEESELYNIETPCIHCRNEGGFELVGKIAELNPDEDSEEEDSEDEEIEDEEEDDDDEEEIEDDFDDGEDFDESEYEEDSDEDDEEEDDDKKKNESLKEAVLNEGPGSGVEVLIDNVELTTYNYSDRIKGIGDLHMSNYDSEITPIKNVTFTLSNFGGRAEEAFDENNVTIKGIFGGGWSHSEFEGILKNATLDGIYDSYTCDVDIELDSDELLEIEDELWGYEEYDPEQNEEYFRESLTEGADALKYKVNFDGEDHIYTTWADAKKAAEEHNTEYTKFYDEVKPEAKQDGPTKTVYTVKNEDGKLVGTYENKHSAQDFVRRNGGTVTTKQVAADAKFFDNKKLRELPQDNKTPKTELTHLDEISDEFKIFVYKHKDEIQQAKNVVEKFKALQFAIKANKKWRENPESKDVLKFLADAIKNPVVYPAYKLTWDGKGGEKSEIFYDISTDAAYKKAKKQQKVVGGNITDVKGGKKDYSSINTMFRNMINDGYNAIQRLQNNPDPEDLKKDQKKYGVANAELDKTFSDRGVLGQVDMHEYKYNVVDKNGNVVSTFDNEKAAETYSARNKGTSVQKIDNEESEETRLGRIQADSERRKEKEAKYQQKQADKSLDRWKKRSAPEKKESFVTRSRRNAIMTEDTDSSIVNILGTDYVMPSKGNKAKTQEEKILLKLANKIHRRRSKVSWDEEKQTIVRTPLPDVWETEGDAIMSLLRQAYQAAADKNKYDDFDEYVYNAFKKIYEIDLDVAAVMAHHGVKNSRKYAELAYELYGEYVDKPIDDTDDFDDYLSGIDTNTKKNDTSYNYEGDYGDDEQDYDQYYAPQYDEEPSAGKKKRVKKQSKRDDGFDNRETFESLRRRKIKEGLNFNVETSEGQNISASEDENGVNINISKPKKDLGFDDNVDDFNPDLDMEEPEELDDLPSDETELTIEPMEEPTEEDGLNFDSEIDMDEIPEEEEEEPEDFEELPEDEEEDEEEKNESFNVRRFRNKSITEAEKSPKKKSDKLKPIDVTNADAEVLIRDPEDGALGLISRADYTGNPSFPYTPHWKVRNPVTGRWKDYDDEEKAIQASHGNPDDVRRFPEMAKFDDWKLKDVPELLDMLTKQGKELGKNLIDSTDGGKYMFDRAEVLKATSAVPLDVEAQSKLIDIASEIQSNENDSLIVMMKTDADGQRRVIATPNSNLTEVTKGTTNLNTGTSYQNRKGEVVRTVNAATSNGHFTDTASAAIREPKSVIEIINNDDVVWMPLTVTKSNAMSSINKALEQNDIYIKVESRIKYETNSGYWNDVLEIDRRDTAADEKDRGNKINPLRFDSPENADFDSDIGDAVKYRVVYSFDDSFEGDQTEVVRTSKSNGEPFSVITAMEEINSDKMGKGVYAKDTLGCTSVTIEAYDDSSETILEDPIIYEAKVKYSGDWEVTKPLGYSNGLMAENYPSLLRAFVSSVSEREHNYAGIGQYDKNGQQTSYNALGMANLNPDHPGGDKYAGYKEIQWKYSSDRTRAEVTTVTSRNNKTRRSLIDSLIKGKFNGYGIKVIRDTIEGTKRFITISVPNPDQPVLLKVDSKYHSQLVKIPNATTWDGIKTIYTINMFCANVQDESKVIPLDNHSEIALSQDFVKKANKNSKPNVKSSAFEDARKALGDVKPRNVKFIAEVSNYYTYEPVYTAVNGVPESGYEEPKAIETDDVPAEVEAPVQEESYSTDTFSEKSFQKVIGESFGNCTRCVQTNSNLIVTSDKGKHAMLEKLSDDGFSIKYRCLAEGKTKQLSAKRIRNRIIFD